MPTLATILAAIAAIGTDIPELTALFKELEQAAQSPADAKAIADALDTAADDAFKQSQS